MKSGYEGEEKRNDSIGTKTVMPDDVKGKMENSFGTDFSNVNIHQNSNRAENMGALAYTQGNDIAFASGQYQPDTTAGQKLLGHELGHVVQQRQGRVRPDAEQHKGMNINSDTFLEKEADLMGEKAAQGKQNNLGINSSKSNIVKSTQLKNNIIQKLGVDDVTQEMVGKKFELVDSYNSIPKGTIITITNWNGINKNATGKWSKKDKTVATSTFSKSLLKPVYSATAGISKYEVGIEKQRSTLKSSKGKVDTWKKREKEYSKNRSLWEAELKRLEGLHTKRETRMSRMLVRESMYNRFDADIKKWVDFYNNKYKPSKKLDPNIVKSIIFIETRMGTSRIHLEKPPYNYHGNPHPIKSRFNLGQVIDSFGPQQFLMIKEMAPSIYTSYGFNNYEKNAKWKGMTVSEWSNNNFFNAIKTFSTFKNTNGKNLKGNNTDLFLDYEFWIRATVKWLFEKYFATKNWNSAIKAYNGAGKKADNYKKDVLTRVNKNSVQHVGDK